MVVLLVILLVTIGLAVRAGLYRSRFTVTDSEQNAGEDSWLIDACARSFVLVLLSLMGLFALGVLYGNVLGAAHTGP
jgi:hypothetical protein